MHFSSLVQEVLEAFGQGKLRAVRRRLRRLPLIRIIPFWSKHCKLEVLKILALL